ncbi:hypothetical protein NBRC116601_33470 [Cognatishimia sp. WU-CL00825]|uniref:SGNH/GDSL hydrolase family protein n=1 Tax=Cognatishimia sp. WU-CL00825 TaxID=3127658 RepID=UPI0031027150
MQITVGLGLGSTALTGPGAAPNMGLVKPQNLYTAAQADFSETAHINLRGNWTVAQGDLQQITGNGSMNDVRMDLDTPIVAGHPHIALWQAVPGTTGTYRSQYGGDGSLSGVTLSGDDLRPKFHWTPAGDITGNYTRYGWNPTHDALDLQITDVALYDLATVDPNTVACDVVLCLGDSNMGNAVSDLVTDANLTTAFDPRVWYMPSLRMSPYAFNNTYSLRHVPQPCIEPVQASSGAARMSPLQAFGAQFAPYATERGRPVLLLSLGDAGAGLNGSEDWRKSSGVAVTGGRMYGEMLAMVAALQALGPAHQIVGAIVSIGANDTTGADYNTVWVPQATQFVADLRAEPSLNNANLPIVWLTPGSHYEPISGEDRGARMIAAIETLDQDSGSAQAITGLKSVRPPNGNQLTPGDASDPHFNATGMQANGTVMADMLRGML